MKAGALSNVAPLLFQAGGQERDDKFTTVMSPNWGSESEKTTRRQADYA